LRDESELVGWDPDGGVQEERPRSAERFLDYVRAVARGEAASGAYFVSAANAKVAKVHPAGNAAFTATSYTLQYAGGVGSRWNVFPAAVNWNQGIANCTTSQLAPGEFASVIAHELGDTLGFRHSDQNRLFNAPCSTYPTLECSSQALMNHILVSGLNGQLHAWDKTALDAVYGNGPACLPPSIAQQPSGSTIASGATAQLSVNAAGTGPLSYQWYSGASGNTSSPVSGGSSATVLVSPSASTSYWVRVTGQCAP